MNVSLQRHIINNKAKISWFLTRITQIEIVTLSCIIAAGTALRFYKLGEWSYGPDEAFTILGHFDGMNSSLLRESVSHGLIRLFVDWFGASEWNARLIPAIIGIITIPILFYLFKRLFSPAVAMWGTFLLAISPWHLNYSQHARYYVALILFYTLALCLFYIALEDDKPSFMIGALFFTGLALKERPVALLIVPVMLTYLLTLFVFKYEKPKGLNTRNLSILFVPGAILGVLFLLPYIQQLDMWLDGFRYFSRASGQSGPRLFYLQPMKFAVLAITWITIPVAILCPFGTIYLHRQRSRSGLIMSIGATVPAIGMMVLFLLFRSAGLHYIIVVLPCCIALCATAILALLENLNKGHLSCAIAIVVLLMISSSNTLLWHFYGDNGMRPEFRSAFKFVESQMNENDLVVTTRPRIAELYGVKNYVSASNLEPSEIISSDRNAWFIGDFTYSPYKTQYSLIQVTSSLSKWLQNNGDFQEYAGLYLATRREKPRVYKYQTVP